jgi:hypothetical protein
MDSTHEAGFTPLSPADMRTSLGDMFSNAFKLHLKPEVGSTCRHMIFVP